MSISATKTKVDTTRVNTEKEKRFVINQIKKCISDLDFLIKIKDKESFCKLFAESAFTVEFISDDNNPRNKEISLGTLVKPDKCYLCEFATEVSEDSAESDFIISEGREVPFGVSAIYLLENYSGKFYFAKAFRKYPIFETLKENIREKFNSDSKKENKTMDNNKNCDTSSNRSFLVAKTAINNNINLNMAEVRKKIDGLRKILGDDFGIDDDKIFFFPNESELAVMFKDIEPRRFRSSSCGGGIIINDIIKCDLRTETEEIWHLSYCDEKEFFLSSNKNIPAKTVTSAEDNTSLSKNNFFDGNIQIRWCDESHNEFEFRSEDKDFSPIRVSTIAYGKSFFGKYVFSGLPWALRWSVVEDDIFIVCLVDEKPKGFLHFSSSKTTKEGWMYRISFNRVAEKGIHDLVCASGTGVQGRWIDEKESSYAIKCISGRIKIDNITEEYSVSISQDNHYVNHMCRKGKDGSLTIIFPQDDIKICFRQSHYTKEEENVEGIKKSLYKKDYLNDEPKLMLKSNTCKSLVTEVQGEWKDKNKACFNLHFFTKIGIKNKVIRTKGFIRTTGYDSEIENFGVEDFDDFKGAEYFYWIKDTEKLCILFPQINTKIVFDDIDDIGTRKTGKIVAMPKITGNRDGEDSLKMELYGIVEKAVDLEIDTNLLPEFIKRAAEEYNNI
jgi:hypothetical protein